MLTVLQAIELSKKYLEEKGVKFSVKDVGSDADAVREMIEKSGQQGVPVIDVNGTIKLSFDEEKLKEVVKLK